MSNPFRTTKIQSFTTQLLVDLDRSPELRTLAAFAVSLLVCSMVTLTYLWQPAAEQQTARAPIAIIQTATPRTAPTMQPATPAPAPEVKELPSGAIVAWNGKEWSVLREAPTPAPAVVVEQPAPEPPVIQQVIYEQAPEPAPAAEPEQPAPAPEVEQVAATAAPAPATFVASFHEAGSTAATFNEPQCAPQFITYLPGHECYGK
jgi:hypothetical protein